MFVGSGLFTLFTACLTSSVLAQEPTGTVMGSVVDSANQPMSGVLVFVDEGPGSATTGEVGAFRLEGVTAGTHSLSLRKAGFAPRTFNLRLEPNEDRRDVGVIVLEEGPDPRGTLTGRVIDGVSGQPLEGAVVELNGEAIATTGDDGGFRASAPVAWGSNQIQVGGLLSYADETAELWVSDPNETFDLAVTLHPIPIELSRVVAGADRAPFVPPKMQGFYKRRGETPGIFLTHSEIIAKDPRRLTDALSGVRFNRRASTFGGSRCGRPLVFFDGAFIDGGRFGVDINELASPEQVEGIEVYTGIAAVPTEFRLLGSGCGVIVIWTR